jgi:hypothetical protein
MGVLIPSSILMKSGKAERGVRAERADSSEGKVDGKVEVIGVLSCGSLGLVAVAAAILTLGKGNECS